MVLQSKRNDELYMKIIVPFEKALRGPQKFVCASERLLL
jgi:hypothetical protein